MLNRLKGYLPRFTLMAGALWLSVAGCATETGYFRNAITGEECVPDESYVPREHGGENGNGNTSPTGIPGDNLDDLRSGKIDCLGDGNSGQGDDKKHNCQFPPGCDSNGCCDGDTIPEEPVPEEPTPEEPTPEEPTPEEPTPEEPTPEEPPIIVE